MGIEITWIRAAAFCAGDSGSYEYPITGIDSKLAIQITMFRDLLNFFNRQFSVQTSDQIRQNNLDPLDLYEPRRNRTRYRCPMDKLFLYVSLTANHFRTWMPGFPVYFLHLFEKLYIFKHHFSLKGRLAPTPQRRSFSSIFDWLGGVGGSSKFRLSQELYITTQGHSPPFYEN